MGFYRSALNNGQYPELVVVDGENASTYLRTEGLLPENFNGTVSIGNKVTNCSHMFYYCTNFNQPITIPSSVTNCSYMFYKCTSLSSDINIKGTAYRSLNIYSMLSGKNNSKRINVRFNSVLNNIFNVSTAGYTLVSSIINWTTMTNGFYNTVYNVYCYYNYAG